MNILKKNILIVLLFLSSLFLFVSPSFAKNCNKYARDAVNSHAANKANGCGYSGSGWHSNFGLHQGWCLIAPASQVNGATRTRIRKMSACLMKRGVGGMMNPPGAKGDVKAQCRRWAKKMARADITQDRICGNPPVTKCPKNALGCATPAQIHANRLRQCLAMSKAKRKKQTRKWLNDTENFNRKGICF